MNKFNIYKLLFYILLVPYILLAIYLFWSVKDKGESQDTIQDIQSTCQKELEASNSDVDEYNGVPKPIDFSDLPEAKRHYTRITETAERGVNFAERYSLAILGCGTDCASFAVTNVETGKVIAYRPANPSYILLNEGSYLVLEPVYAEQTREYYKIVDDKLELVCTEKSTQDMYPNLPEDVRW
ncbi:MAG: hypothetical protein QY322_03635 [bacterium]|nr:MAG: hypothetical protein QY322_03635 [bacterium]